jgi:hypothetical protein
MRWSQYHEIRLALPARVLELAYRGALKALAPMGHVGSNPTPGICRASRAWERDFFAASLFKDRGTAVL